MNEVTKKKKILIVDDDPVIIKTFSLALEDSGLSRTQSTQLKTVFLYSCVVSYQMFNLIP